MRLFSKWLGVILGLIFQTAMLLAQGAMPTVNILTRVFMVKSRYGTGTIFSIDVDNREYWITAKHILTGAKHPPYGSIKNYSISLRLRNPGGPSQQWFPFNFSAIDPGNDVDIVVLAPPKPILEHPLPSEIADPSGFTLGGDCEFLGFPYGSGWLTTMRNGHSWWMPFVKHCTVSSFFTETQGIIVLDGINNVGFSGGPVIIGTGPEQKIIAVISGYYLEPTEVLFSDSTEAAPKRGSGNPGPTVRPRATVNLNSGFIIAYNIKYATEAIRKNPIGPLRKAGR